MMAHMEPDTAGFASRWTGVPFVVPFTKLFLWLGFQAEQVCFLWSILGILSGLLFATGNYWLGILGVILFQISHILDGVDGAIARYNNLPTVRGAYLDLVGHATVNPLVIYGIAIGVFINPPSYIPLPNYSYLILGTVAAVYFTLVNVARLKVFEALIDKKLISRLQKQRETFKPGKQRNIRGTIKGFFRIDPFSAFFFAVIFNLRAEFIIIYAILLPVLFFSRWRKEYLAIKKGIDEAKEGQMHISLSTTKH